MTPYDTLASDDSIVAGALARRNRAEAEGVNYEWRDLPGGRSVCINPATKGVYLVTEQGCACEDWMWWGRHRNAPCKHLIAYRLRKLEAGRCEPEGRSGAQRP